MKSHHKFSKNCNINSKNLDIFVPYKFWTPVKRNIPDVWNWNCWTLFGLEIEVGGGGGGGGGGVCPPSPPVAMSLWQTVFLKNDFFKKKWEQINFGKHDQFSEI